MSKVDYCKLKELVSEKSLCSVGTYNNMTVNIEPSKYNGWFYIWIIENIKDYMSYYTVNKPLHFESIELYLKDFDFNVHKADWKVKDISDSDLRSLLKIKQKRTPNILKEKPLIYFIQGGDRIKIGISNEPKKRLKGLKNSSPLELKIIATMKGSYKKEQSLHAKFDHLRCHGEWFEAKPDLIDYINQNAKVY